MARTRGARLDPALPPTTGDALAAIAFLISIDQDAVFKPALRTYRTGDETLALANHQQPASSAQVGIGIWHRQVDRPAKSRNPDCAGTDFHLGILDGALAEPVDRCKLAAIHPRFIGCSGGPAALAPRAVLAPSMRIAARQHGLGERRGQYQPGSIVAAKALGIEDGCVQSLLAQVQIGEGNAQPLRMDVVGNLGDGLDAGQQDSGRFRLTFLGGMGLTNHLA